jgi:23S rRNA (cytosine1962-C5)-methyltransferase
MIDGRDPDVRLVFADGFSDHELLDAGDGRKLERFGGVVLDRPEPQAMWRPRLDAAAWAAAHARFAAGGDDENGRWTLARPVPETWPMRWRGIAFGCRLTSFRHVGVFPDQEPHWAWLADAVGRRAAAGAATGGEPPRILNLFAYTGVASLAAAAAGARVTHVDASRKALDWARENQAASGLPADGIRWILDDAKKFVAREVRRGSRYDGILVDPPKYGHGPKGEVWDVFADLRDLLEGCRDVLAPGGFLVLTVYALRASFVAIDRLARDVLAPAGGRTICGELVMRSKDGRTVVPTSLYVRYEADGAP